MLHPPLSWISYGVFSLDFLDLFYLKFLFVLLPTSGVRKCKHSKRRETESVKITSDVYTWEEILECAIAIIFGFHWYVTHWPATRRWLTRSVLKPHVLLNEDHIRTIWCMRCRKTRAGSRVFDISRIPRSLDDGIANPDLSVHVRSVCVTYGWSIRISFPWSSCSVSISVL